MLAGDEMLLVGAVVLVSLQSDTLIRITFPRVLGDRRTALRDIARKNTTSRSGSSLQLTAMARDNEH